MGDIAFWDEELRDRIESLRRNLTTLANLQGAAKSNAIKKCKDSLGDIKGKTMRTFTFELRTLDRESKETYQQKLKRYNEEIKKLEVELEWAQKDALLGNRPDDHNGAGSKQPVMSTDQMLRGAQDIQDKTEESLKRTRDIAKETTEIGDATINELEKQNEQLKNIDQSLQNIQTELDRAKEVLTAIARRASTDKLLVLMLVVGAVAILAIIVYVSLRPESDDNGLPPVVQPPISNN